MNGFHHIEDITKIMAAPLNRAVPPVKQATALQIDVDNMFADQVGDSGIPRSLLDEVRAPLADIHGRLNDDARKGLDGEFAPLTLGRTMTESLKAINAEAAKIRQHADVVVIGIGGSSLGAKAVWQALRAQLSETSPRLHFVENVDPYDLNQTLLHLDPADTAVIAISKSGGTLETVVQFLVLREWLEKKLGRREAKARQWVVTDPKQGWMRKLADAENIPSLPVPPQVGGRYSVLTAVGLLPLAAVGVDIEALLAGAADSAERCASDELESSAALTLASLYYLLDVKRQKRVSIMMPYVNRLRLFVDWYCQLWAESLGKQRKDRDPAGTLPVRAMGAVDQHSQLQMYLESRLDKMFTFLELMQWEHKLAVPLNGHEAAFPYLQARTLADVIHAEFRATRQTITEAGHPNVTILMPALNAHTMGQLIDLYQRTTIYTGMLYGINPLDQPSVEKGKLLAVDHLRKQQPSHH